MENAKHLWKERGAENPYHWVLTHKTEWNREEFYASGEEDIRTYVVPFLEKHGITSSQAGQFHALDIGCGTGRLTRALVNIFGRAIGVDISPTMIAQAKVDHAGEPRVTFLETSGVDLVGLADASIDFCFSFISLQHVLRKSIVCRYFAEIYRILKPGGFGKIQVRGAPGNPPGRVLWFKGLESRYIAVVLWRGIFPLLWTRKYRDLYGACFKPEELRQAFDALGFTSVTTWQESGRNLWVEFKKKNVGMMERSERNPERS